MTFADLNSRYNNALTESEWHQHANGGGWVYKDASMSKEAFVGDRAVVWGGTILGGTILGGTIEGGTIWGGTIEGGTIWGGTIEGGTITKQPLVIMGSKHAMTNSKPGHITIGCQTHTVEWWAENYRAVGEKEGYTPDEIEEYGRYIELFVRQHQDSLKDRRECL